MRVQLVHAISLGNQELDKLEYTGVEPKFRNACLVLPMPDGIPLQGEILIPSSNVKVIIND